MTGDLEHSHSRKNQTNEWASIFLAVLLLFVVASLPSIVTGQTIYMLQIFSAAFIVVIVPVLMRKAFAHSLDAEVKHRIWHFYRYGYRPSQHLPKEIPLGIFVPLFFAFLGALAQFTIMVTTFLTYEARALKYRAAKRFGFYSYSSMSDWHIGLIGASGIITSLILSLVGFYFDFVVLAKLAAYYAFWNMLPFSDLDGTHIFFGNRVLWTVLAVTTVIFVLYASYMNF